MHYYNCIKIEKQDMYLIMYFDENNGNNSKPIVNVLNQAASISTARSMIRDYAVTHVRNECGIKQSEKAFVDSVELDKLHDGLSLYRSADESEIEVWYKNTNIESSYYLFSTPITTKKRIGYFRFVYYERPQQGESLSSQESIVQTNINRQSMNQSTELRKELYKELSSVLSDGLHGLHNLRKTKYDHDEDKDEDEEDYDEERVSYKMLRARATGMSLDK